MNERGYEQVILPAGSRILTNGQTNNQPTSEGRQVTINLGGVTITGPMQAAQFGNMLRDQLTMAGV
jgi:hypothetical protein